ncbi:MAG: helix-turn-helix domain-containing protein [Elusimicrobiaceae bacterium]|nr:helix-turn-helix domain-containing protein [Elusimicrobiaceae bacterium]
MKFLTSEQIAHILQVNKMTVYREIKRGKLKSYKFGKELRIRNSDFEAYLQDAYQAAQQSIAVQHSCITPTSSKTIERGKMAQQTASKKPNRTANRPSRTKIVKKATLKKVVKSQSNFSKQSK